MDPLIALELMFPFVVALIFSIGYFWKERPVSLFFGLVAFISWIICGQIWLLTVPEQYALAWWFHGFGIIYLVLSVGSILMVISDAAANRGGYQH